MAEIILLLARVLDFLFTPIAMIIWIPILVIAYRRQLKRRRAARQRSKEV